MYVSPGMKLWYLDATPEVMSFHVLSLTRLYMPPHTRKIAIPARTLCSSSSEVNVVGAPLPHAEMHSIGECTRSTEFQ